MRSIDTQIAVDREAIGTIARSWLGTPYHHMGRVKGAGVDCAMFPLEVYREAGMIGDIEVAYYPHDWMLHRSEEVYLSIVQRYAREHEPEADSRKPEAGDFVLYHFGRCWAHGAIILEWPLIIHAVVHHGVILSDGEKEGMLVGRKRRFFAVNTME